MVGRPPSLPIRPHNSWDEALEGHFAEQRRESLNLLKNPRDRPVNWHRLRRRVGEEFFGSLLRASTAASRSSIVFIHIENDLFKPCRLSHLFFTILSRFFCFATRRFFCHCSSYFLRAGPFWRCLRLGSFLLIT